MVRPTGAEAGWVRQLRDARVRPWLTKTGRLVQDEAARYTPAARRLPVLGGHTTGFGQHSTTADGGEGLLHATAAVSHASA